MAKDNKDPKNSSVAPSKEVVAKADAVEASASSDTGKKTQTVKAQTPESTQTESEVSKEEVSTSEASDSKKQDPKKQEVELSTLFAFKLGMGHIYDENNKFIPVTALKYKPLTITQIKTTKKDGYEALQVAIESKKSCSKSVQGHLEQAGIKKSASLIKEVRQSLPKGVALGQTVSIESLKVGDKVVISGVSKGHGFAGVMKRWGFGGGGASHGTEKHRTTGSIANTATQGRVFPGKKLPGHYGCDRTTIKNLKVMKVVPSENMIFVAGSVPGAISSLIEVRKQG